MKVLILELNGKRYTTGKITAYLSRQALKIQKESLELSEKAQKLKDNSQNAEMKEIGELLSSMEELRTSKANLICEVYQNKFDIDDLEKELSDQEIDAEINKILNGITGVISKN